MMPRTCRERVINEENEEDDSGRTYHRDEEQGIISLDISHDIPASEDTGCDEEDHQHHEGIGGDGDISSMVVVGDGEEWREGAGHRWGIDGCEDRVLIEY
jgi:hypothetical protein